ncbi:MAG: aspartate/glutamate racemase family protein [Desulfobacterales bacterium]|nr:aspartate/glutamate racemase family protein [Desulfobacterales bacterium]
MFKIRKSGRAWYGESIGILILNAGYPCIPGNVGNATTFPFPVRYKMVREASIERLLHRQDRSLLKPFIDAARELQQEGVRAVTGACGFMALFQREIAEALEIPVFLSSLLQIPFIRQTLKQDQAIGVITADASALTDDHFAAVGVTPEIPLVIAGMEGQTEFKEAILEEKGTLDSDRIQAEVVQVAGEMVQKHSKIGAILLECSDLPPYAHAVQQTTGLPVYDFTTMIGHVHSALVRTSFQGFI